MTKTKFHAERQNKILMCWTETLRKMQSYSIFMINVTYCLINN